MSYLSRYDRDQVLLEVIADLDALVKKNRIAAAGAFYVIVETAKKSASYPKEEPKPAIPAGQAPIEVTLPPAPVVEAAPAAGEPVAVIDRDVSF